MLDDDDDDDHHLMSGIGDRKYGFPQGKPFLDDVGRAGTGHDEDDILGDLSKPVEVVIASKVFLFLFLKKKKTLK